MGGHLFSSERGMDLEPWAAWKAGVEASAAFQGLLRDYVMTCSVSCKGDRGHNAPTENFFNSLKNERVHGKRYLTKEQAKTDLFEYIEVFYTRRRRHSGLDYRSPVQYLQHWIDAGNQVHQAA